MLTVSNYHYIREGFQTQYPSIFGLTPSEFENQLEKLSLTGTFITQKTLLNDLDEVLHSTTNYLLITFDDGLKEQYKLAKPILDKLNIEGIFYINSINFTEEKVSTVHKIHMLRTHVDSEIIVNKININTENKVKLSTSEFQKAKSHYLYDDEKSAYLKYLLNFKMPYFETEKIMGLFFSEHFDEKKVNEELYLSADQLELLAQKGMLCNHFHSHYALGLLKEEEIINEINLTKKFIDNFGNNSEFSISYSYGSKVACQYPVSQIAKRNGHNVGFTTEKDVNYQGSDTLLLKLFDCNDLVGGKNYNNRL